MLVSVYLPTRNRRPLLERAVNSVLIQTHKELELIIVNDGSSDDTFDYLENLRTQDARVKAIHNEVSLGAPKSRNKAIALSSGQFVTGLDDDDRFDSNRLKAFLQYWEMLREWGEQFSFLYSQDVLELEGPAIRRSEKPGSVSYEQLMYNNFVGSQIFAKRDTYLEVGGFDEDMPAWQDWDLFIRIVDRFGPARLLDAGLYFFNLEPRPDRISNGSKERYLSAYRRLINKNARATRQMKQKVFLQIFSPYYGFKPQWTDWLEFMKFRPGVRDWIHFIRDF